MSSARLLSWGNHPPFPQTATACHWRGDLPAHLARARRDHGTTLPYGAGLSYGDSCLAASDHVLHVRPFDRFIGADWSSGVITAEAGVTLEEILAVAIPRGWFLPVTPGTRYVTVGGAIANDVHGKNHHRRGTFGRHVRRFGLVRSDSGRLVCSREQHPELFNATIGGLGLAGIVEWAEIQLVPIRASQLDVITQRFGDLDEFFALSAELDARHEFCVSWIDCAARGTATGRGVYVAGDFAQEGTLSLDRSRKFTVPLTSPVPLVNGLSLRAFNELYWRRAPRARKKATVGYGPFFYPLDTVLKWNRLYGRNGFQQYQALVPESAARTGIRALLQVIARSGTGSFLAVLKRCGDMPSPGLLSFPQAGITLALDFPQTDQLDSSLFRELDAIVRDAGGRLYPAKDAHMSGDDFRRAYPAWERLEAVRDPALMSRFWERVTR
jgi:FAD/FMN-containing dehydrogenase